MGKAVGQTVIGIYTPPTQMPFSVTLSIVLCKHNLSLPLPLVRSLFFVAHLILSHCFILINLVVSSFGGEFLFVQSSGDDLFLRL